MAALAAQRRTAKDLKALRRLVEEFEAESDPARRVRVDSQFHVAVATATGNSLFARLVEDLRGAVEEQSLAVSLVPGRRRPPPASTAPCSRPLGARTTPPPRS